MRPEIIQLIGDLMVAISPALVALIGFLAVKLAKFIKAKSDNALVEGGLLKLNDAVFTVVKELEQTMASEFAKAAADGVISPEEKAMLKAAAMDKLKGYVSFSELSRLFGLSDPEAFVGAKVEAAVHDLKAIKASLPKR